MSQPESLKGRDHFYDTGYSVQTHAMSQPESLKGRDHFYNTWYSVQSRLSIFVSVCPSTCHSAGKLQLLTWNSKPRKACSKLGKRNGLFLHSVEHELLIISVKKIRNKVLWVQKGNVLFNKKPASYRDWHTSGHIVLNRSPCRLLLLW
jgi:hypothetical protein